MVDWLSLPIDLVLTALIYGFVPMLSVLLFGRMKIKTYKKVCVVSSCCLAVLFFILNEIAETGHTTSYAPAIIWGWVFYKIGVSIINRRKAKRSLETWYTCPNCGCLVHTGENCDCGYQYKTRRVIEPVKEIVELYIQPDYNAPPAQPKKRRVLLVSLIIVSLLLAASVSYSFTQRQTLNDLNVSFRDLEIKYESLDERYQKMRELYGTEAANYDEIDRYIDFRYQSALAAGENVSRATIALEVLREKYGYFNVTSKD